jgi:dienelactone hydrolase
MPVPDPDDGTQPARRAPRARWVLFGVLAAVVAVLITVGAAGSVSNEGNESSTASAANSTYAGPGPEAAGTLRVTLADGDGAQLWYPAERSAVVGRTADVARMSTWLSASEAAQPTLAALGAPLVTRATEGAPVAPVRPGAASDHGFPVAVFAPSAGSTPEESSTLMDHLASWGFVVVAPDLRVNDLQTTLTETGAAPDEATVEADETGELDRALAYLRASDQDASSPLHHRLDLTEVGVVGLGSGGGAAITLAALDPAVATYVALAPTSVSTPANIPAGLVMYGTRDTVVSPASVQQLWAGLPAPRRLVVVDGAGYNAFDDDCAIHAGTQTLGAQLATDPSDPIHRLGVQDDDGCQSPDLTPSAAQPLVFQAVTAQLRFGLGIDATPVGLDTGLDDAFSGVTASYYQKG